MLIDSFGRLHTNLRVSVTDRCNIRCFYCMPNDNVQFKPRDELLTFEEITRFVRVMAEEGVNKLRLTGGEPLVRQDLHLLIRQLSEVDGINDIAITTNAILLPDQAADLKRAGLQRLNISLDTLSETTFQQISRRKGLDRVLSGIDAAIDVGFQKIRLNAVSLAGITEKEAVALTEFAAGRGLEMRFIEFMPLDAEGSWDSNTVLTGSRVKELLESHLGKLSPSPREDPSQPAVDYDLPGGGTVGFINPVSEPFCASCNRLRLTAEGQIRNCLFSEAEWNVRDLLRDGGTDAEIASVVRQSISAKKLGHGIDNPEFAQPTRAMYQIGG
jgi:cyclic pyranopterin phosphate synthase